MRRRPVGPNSRAWLLALSTAIVAACGGDSTGPDDSINALVGSWDAIKMVVVNKANPSVAPDLTKLGVTFYVNIQPSGQYTAILTSFGQPATEFGRVEVINDQLTLHREQPGPARSDTGTFRISRDTLYLAGDTEFDFNFDGLNEPARLLTDFKRRN